MSLLRSFINLMDDGCYKHPAHMELNHRNSPEQCRQRVASVLKAPTSRRTPKAHH